LTTRFSIDGGLLRLVQSGQYDVEAFLQALADALRDPAYVAGMPALLDARGQTSPATNADRERIRHALNDGPLRAFRPRRYAIVSLHPESEKLAKLAQILIVDALEGAFRPELRHFDVIEAAEAWVREAPPPSAPP